MVRFKASIAVAALAGLSLTACPDPESEFDEHFENIEDHLDVAFDAAVLPDQGVAEVVPEASGTYLLAIAASVDATKPLLFKATIAVDSTSDPATVDFELIPLVPPAVAMMGNLEERAELPAGTLDPDPVPVTQNEAGEWVFTVEFNMFTLPGDSDPILPGEDIAGTMVWNGRIVNDAVLCGDVGGELTAPAPVPLEGSTFGVIQIGEGETVADPESPARDCAESLQ